MTENHFGNIYDKENNKRQINHYKNSKLLNQYALKTV